MNSLVTMWNKLPENVKTWVERVGWTFVQAYVGVLIVFGGDAWTSKKAQVAALAAAASAVKNVAKTTMEARKAQASLAEVNAEADVDAAVAGDCEGCGE